MALQSVKLMLAHWYFFVNFWYFLLIISDQKKICFNFWSCYLLFDLVLLTAYTKSLPVNLPKCLSRGRSRAAATSKMERFVIIVNVFQPLTIITKRFQPLTIIIKRSILDVATAPDPLLLSTPLLQNTVGRLLLQNVF